MPAPVFADFDSPDYETVWGQQKALVEARIADTIGDTVLMGEHAPIITLGRGTHRDNLLNPTVPVLEIERGGDVTYHGPGQLVVYPIIKLQKLQGVGRDLHAWLRLLEEAVIRTLSEFGITGMRLSGKTGVWVEVDGRPMKIASVGVAVKSWVTYHGLALNVSTDLSAFDQINPCGFDSAVMTTMRALDQPEVTVAAVSSVMRRVLRQLLEAA